ncbi:MAG TPA: hypothetical protein PLQ88_08905 [Blastocatellia bacterium]|nr:hypothetical protein [Blastocatellia bacterium]
MAEELFKSQFISDAVPLRFLKRATLTVLVLYLISGLESSYRAYYQVHRLALRSADQVLRNGSVIETEVVSYARTTVTVKVELLQGQTSETLAVYSVPGNYFAAIDPRWRHAAQPITITPENLSRFQNGRAILRATATGRPQWMRLPPPLVRELAVEIRRFD